MKIHFLFLLMLTIILLNGCATTHDMELTAAALPDQKTDPYGAVVSEKYHMVSMSHYKQIGYMWDNAIFNIIIENGGEEPLTIGNENISIIFEGHDKKHTVKKLDVLSATEFMQDVEYEYRKRALNALSQLVHAKDYLSAYSLDGEKVRYYVVFPSGVKPSSRGNLNIKTLRETLPVLILEQKTIMPRDSISVLISCRTNDIPRRIKGDFKINVSIDGEEHGFSFTRK